MAKWDSKVFTTIEHLSNMNPFDPNNRTDRAPDPSNNSWVSEDIWGHRIERQPCFLLLLEFLSMAEAMHRTGRLLNNAMTSSEVTYRPYLSTQLRNILFKNPLISEILIDRGNTEQAWDEWFASMSDSVAKHEDLKDYSYLKTRFDDFETFESVVKLLSRISIKELDARQWNHMRIYPIGPAAYYDERDRSFNSGRTQFTRTGELAYLMLARSTHHKNEIKAALEKAFDTDGSKNQLLCTLMRDKKPDLSDSDKSGTYLPYKVHPSYDLLAEDVHALFHLNMPAPDAFLHLAPLLAFHVMLYQLRTAAAVLEIPAPAIICEILAPRSTQVRKASIECINNNEILAVESVTRFFNKREALDEKITRILTEDDPKEQSTVDDYRTALKSLFSIKDDPAGITIEEVRQSTLKAIHKNYKDSAGDGLRSMADEAGLRSRIKSRQHRYCPSDQFLRSMVLVNVTKSIKETDFLTILNKRYGIVIGAVQANGTVDPVLFQKNEFENNANRLVSRLVAMGLARRMSDSFTYIINPITKDHAS